MARHGDKHDSPLFFDRLEDAAPAWGLSPGGLTLAKQRGELPRAYVQIGRSVKFSKVAPALAALGLSEPEALGRFIAAAGIRTLAELMEFMSTEAQP